MIPPTWVTLHTLAEASSVDDALARMRSTEPNVYVTRIGRAAGVAVSMWAGDAGYDDGDADKPGPRHRLLMADDGWKLERDI